MIRIVLVVTIFLCAVACASKHVTDVLHPVATQSQKGSVQKTIEGKHDLLKQCYESQLDQDSSLEGQMVVTFVIGLDGRAAEVKVIESNLDNADIESCIKHEFSTLKFPRPSGSSKVIVKYPLTFRRND